MFLDVSSLFIVLDATESRCQVRIDLLFVSPIDEIFARSEKKTEILEGEGLRKVKVGRRFVVRRRRRSRGRRRSRRRSETRGKLLFSRLRGRGQISQTGGKRRFVFSSGRVDQTVSRRRRRRHGRLHLFDRRRFLDANFSFVTLPKDFSQKRRR